MANNPTDPEWSRASAQKRGLGGYRRYRGDYEGGAVMEALEPLCRLMAGIYQREWKGTAPALCVSVYVPAGVHVCKCE